MMQLVDSHAHLDSYKYNGDRDAVIKRARKAGVSTILNIGANLDSSRAAIALAEKHDFIYATVGVHPHNAKRVNAKVIDQLRVLARHPKVVAIGEIGLDYYRDLSPRPAQRKAFTDQLALATELELPVVIHSRDAHDDVLEALQEWDGVGVLHSYAGGPELLGAVLEMGFHISIAGPVTFPRAERLREVAATAPLERLLVETDCPYLTPVPRRGKRNEPALVKHVVEAIAHVRDVGPDVVAQATKDNFGCLFGIP
jgi:TatD DNase family protein